MRRSPASLAARKTTGYSPDPGPFSTALKLSGARLVPVRRTVARYWGSVIPMVWQLPVIYPCPKDIQALETVYQRDHVPMAAIRLSGKTKIVASRVLGSPDGKPAFHRIPEIHFPSMEALQACARLKRERDACGRSGMRTTNHSQIHSSSLKSFQI